MRNAIGEKNKRKNLLRTANNRAEKVEITQ